MKKLIFFLFLVSSFRLSAQNEPFRNPALSCQERASDLLKRLSLEEKVELMKNASSGVSRLGIKPYEWWNEALHGVARAGLATVFPQAIGLAASFDADAVEQTFTMVSDEARAKYHKAQQESDFRRYRGLTFWTPNVNIFRDPRWGRGQETYGEDPFLTAQLGMAVVRGLQGPDTARYIKTDACAKHFAVHSGPEWNRHSFNAGNIDPRDLWETYLPAFKSLVTEAGVREVMCAYNRFEGEPCCGSNRLLTRILREQWGYKHIVVSDCNAINDFFMKGKHETHLDSAHASASAVENGTDLECGRIFGSLTSAVEKGLISGERIDESLLRLLIARFELGNMDPDSIVPWSKIPYQVVASTHHRAQALEMARKSMVLLKNNGILPLSKQGLRITVMGPNADDSIMQWGNYCGTPASTVTILEGIRQKAGAVQYVKGCEITHNKVFDSFFARLKTIGGEAGMNVRYWNNSIWEGEPVAEQVLVAPVFQDAGGATVFAPGVNLTGFSARYETVFLPEKSGEISLLLAGYNNQLTVDGKIMLKFWPETTRFKDQANRTCRIQVEKGKPYSICIDFYQMSGDAHMEFDLGEYRDVPLNQVVESVKDADIILFAGGISPRYEGESMKVDYPGFKGGDRTDIELPGIQREILQQLKSAGKKVVLINCSGSAMALVPESESCDAILQAWYPGEEGGTAVADVLFGDYNPAGRLPVTFYRSISQLPDYEDYSMKGRTYRFFEGDPLYPFGFGLSYTSFKYGQPRLDKDNITITETISLVVPVTNTGKLDGEEVVQVYLKKVGDQDGPLKTLRAFRRVPVASGETVEVRFVLSEKELEWWNPSVGSMQVQPGSYRIYSGGSSDEQHFSTTIFKIQ